MSFMKGDTNTDGSRYLPFSDDYMTWDNDTYEYTPTDKLFQDELGINLAIDYGTNNKVNGNVRDIVMEELYSNRNNDSTRVAEFTIARTRNGRSAVKEIYKAQMRYMDFDGDDMDENAGKIVSPRVKKMMISARYNYIGHKGMFTTRVNPDPTDDDGFRNYD